jgi:hypothetical protein
MLSKKRGRKKNNNVSKVQVSKRFLAALAILSIIGFVDILSDSFFGFNLDNYMEALLLIIIGIGLIVEIQIKKLKSISRKGLSRDNFTNIITIVIGFVAIVAGIFSFPAIRIENPSIFAIKGIVSLIAIVIILVQTWVVEK